MIQSFYTGNTGLNANKEWLSIISDNIANVNTIGYKSERVNFEDLISSSTTSFANGSPKNIEIGGGAFAASTIKDFSQGALMNTNSSTDLALDGEGFFMVQDKQGITYYTRNGQFRTDADGNLINTNGMYLKGWSLDEAGNIAGAIGPINIPNDMSPKVTSNLALKSPTNLDATSTIVRNIFNTNDSGTYSYVNAINVYDSIGVSHEVKYYFVHEDANSWKVFGVLDDEPVKFTDANGNQYAFLRVEFNGLGQLNKVSLQGPVSSITGETPAESSDNGEFKLDRAASLPGSIVINSYNDGTSTFNVRWIDDGNGNIVDLDNNNQIIGSVDYDTGKIVINSFVGNGTTESLTVDYNYYSERIANGGSVTSPVLKNSVYIRKYFDGTNWNIVNWADDGNGNIIDLDNNNNVVGTINYSTGAINITGVSSVNQLDVVYEFDNNNSVQPDKITMAAIPTTNNYSQTLNTGGNPIQYTLNLKELKQLQSDFIFYAEQDGYGKGDLLSVSVSEDGLVKGVYSNGQVRDWARIAIATFKDKEILVRKGNNLFLPNSQTFTPIIVPGGVISKIRGGFLELSNVDISQEFINLITAQRAYQANARTITTSDQVLQETMNLKR
ncbi:flagellar hook protein FlgE [Hydrogenothermus marinus]|uniref:Flagellar hook protein FlgE n=1 Tax=Hydrogenothermus marinus TaxID=133270 RepID=A0A3M0BJ60_9AQUI|nr:flagellar hook-basal body complex protein [Hydrogenothermus marinus]RMA97483.1 flagellar hook-basal body protein [Hydrogenothermus marinus]